MAAPAHLTPIYQLTREWTTYEYLCGRHVEVRKKAGWGLKEIGERPGSLAPNECSMCIAERTKESLVTFPFAIPSRGPALALVPEPAPEGVIQDAKKKPARGKKR